MRAITPACKEVAQYLATRLGVDRPPIRRFADESGTSEVFVATFRDNPQSGVNTVATIGLSEFPLMKEGLEFSSRVEFVAAAGSSYDGIDNIVATLAFGVMNSKWFCAPGVIFPGVVALHPGVSNTMTDIYFSYPFLWDDRLKSSEIAGRTVAWLLAVPISERETEYARKHGPQKLEQLFEQSNIDIFNLNRDSVV